VTADTAAPADSSALWHRVILKVTGHFRRRRGQLLTKTFPVLSSYRVCDLGGSRHFWLSAAIENRPERVEVLNITMEAINAAGIGASDAESDDFLFEIYDGVNIPREPGYFDLLLCNSVLEHVPRAARAGLAQEMTRVASRLFVQTPAKGFLVDPHFLMPLVHWVPRPLGRYLARVSPWRMLTHADNQRADDYFDNTQLLGRRELKRLYPGGTLVVERFLGMPKSYVVVVGQEQAS
jgi:hypothetical protein